MIYRLIPILAAVVLITGCGSHDDNKETPEASVKTLQSDMPRETPTAATTDLTTLQNGLGDFAFELYRELNATEKNLFFSPYSVSAAFTMLYAGAAGETKTELHDTFHFLDDDTLHHRSFNLLDRSTFEDEENLTSANSLWLQQGMSVKQDFLDTLILNYGAGVKTVDFTTDPEAARTAINDWVSDMTHGMIPQTLKEEYINTLTRLVLVNTIHFQGSWTEQFSEERTESSDFYLRNGTTTSADMMLQTNDFNYYADGDFSAVSLPYSDNRHKMVIILPDRGMFDTVENNLSRENLATIINNMTSTKIELHMPRFGFDADYNLLTPLKSMGMADAFDSTADFSNISDIPLYISSVIHKAVIEVNEGGTEAAAVTAIIIGATAYPGDIITPVAMNINRPFFFFIMNKDNTILFMGKVENPNG